VSSNPAGRAIKKSTIKVLFLMVRIDIYGELGKRQQPRRAYKTSDRSELAQAYEKKRALRSKTAIKPPYKVAFLIGMPEGDELTKVSFKIKKLLSAFLSPKA
jgi:hypothetical protein